MRWMSSSGSPSSEFCAATAGASGGGAAGAAADAAERALGGIDRRATWRSPSPSQLRGSDPSLHASDALVVHVAQRSVPCVMRTVTASLSCPAQGALPSVLFARHLSPLSQNVGDREKAGKSSAGTMHRAVVSQLSVSTEY